ncbi:right-handed parallel beta-helix repeat-containing protein [Candidatus Dependentiae bacterium]|nr:right-handed parallel beta-helix repeat-containing protein [Candidatus Dependentiae bacterium]
MSGNYCLANDIIGTITISSNEVHLDLNGFSIISTDTTGIAEIPTPPFIIQWGAISMNNVENVSVRNGQLYKLGIFASTCTNVLIDSIASFSCGVPDINCTGMNRLSVSNYSIFNHYGFSSCVSAELSNDISFENFNVNDSQYAQGFTIISIDNFEVENLFLNNPSTPSATINASSIAATSVTNLSIRNVITEAGAIFVVTSTGIIIENVQSSLSTNGFSFMNNVRNVSIADCICRDSDVVGGVLQNIVTGTNIRVSNFNVENCVGNEVILATDITNCVFENYNASECVLSAPAIVVDNTSSGTTTGAQLTFDNWTLNECALISVFNINTAPDIQISRFKVTNNNSLSSISFARVTNSPKVIFDDCIFSDNASNTADNIITAQASDFIRINNVVIENNTFAGGQNGIVFSAGVLLTVTGCEVTNCRIENNALNTSGIPVVSLNLIEATGVQSLNVSGNIINNNVINAVSASENIIIADSASTNATITKNTINSNMFNDGISSVASYINTSAVALIEDNIMIENSSSTGAAFGIQATSNAIVRGNVLNLNQCPLQMIGISVVGEDSVIEKNIVTRNIGSTSTGIQISASRGMVTMNESQQHTNNYITTGGLIIPIAELSYANGIIVPVPVDAPLSSYHNLSMVPQPLSYVSTFSLILELKDTLTVCGIPTPISSSTVITQSGTYCLTQDIVGTITINADNVILDMNNKQITGAVPLVISSHQNILVKNGRITSPGVGGQGIQISSCFDVTFDNILLSTITNTALSISSCENVQVTNCVFIGCVLPISIASSIDTMLKNCTLRDNTGRTTAGGPTSQTVLIIGSTGTVMDNCVLFNNTNYDTITAVSASTNTILQDSSWYSNSVFLQSGGSAANSPRIILSANSSNTVIERCEVNDNSAPVGGSNLYVINSLTGDRTCLIRHCTVARNTPGAAANLFGIAANGSGVVSKNTIFGNTYGAGSPIQTVAGAALIIQNKYDKPASGGVVAEYNYSTTVGVGGISQPPLSPFHNIVQV